MASKKKKVVKKKTVKKQAVKDQGGRPTVYKPEYAAAMYKLCQLGATDTDLAEAFGVTRGTINNWKKKNPEVFIHIKQGKDDSNEKVKNALYHRALGFKCKETKIAMFEGHITDAKNITKHYPPDVRACEIWLINRDPDNWKSRNNEPTGDNGSEEIADALKQLAEALPG